MKINFLINAIHEYKILIKNKRSSKIKVEEFYSDVAGKTFTHESPVEVPIEFSTQTVRIDRHGHDSPSP